MSDQADTSTEAKAQVPLQRRKNSTREEVEEIILLAEDRGRHDVTHFLRWGMAYEWLAGSRPDTSLLCGGADDRWDALSALYQCAADLLAWRQGGLFNVGEMELAFEITDAGRPVTEARMSWQVGDREITVTESRIDPAEDLDE